MHHRPVVNSQLLSELVQVEGPQTELVNHPSPVLASPSSSQNEPEESLKLLVFGHGPESPIVETYELDSGEILK